MSETINDRDFESVHIPGMKINVTEALKPGDAVRHKSGGPRMTIGWPFQIFETRKELAAKTARPGVDQWPLIW